MKNKISWVLIFSMLLVLIQPAMGVFATGTTELSLEYSNIEEMVTNATIGKDIDIPYVLKKSEKEKEFRKNEIWQQIEEESNKNFDIANENAPKKELNNSVNLLVTQTDFDNAASIAINETKDCNIDVGGKEIVYKFTAPTQGTYVFESSGNYDTYGTLYNAEFSSVLTDDDTGVNSNYMIEYPLAANQTVYISSEMYNIYATGTFNVSVIKGGNSELTLNQATTCNINTNGKTMKYTFIPQSDGFYTFRSIGEKGTVGTLLNSNNSQLASSYSNNGSNFTVTYPLKANEGVFLGVRFYNYSDIGTFDVIVEQAPINNIVLDQPVPCNIATINQKNIYKFTAPSNGSYLFESVGDLNTCGTLYDSEFKYIISNTYGGSGSNFAMSKSLQQGESIYLQSELNYGDTTGSFNVLVTKMDIMSGTIKLPNNIKAPAGGLKARIDAIPNAGGSNFYSSSIFTDQVIIPENQNSVTFEIGVPKKYEIYNSILIDVLDDSYVMDSNYISATEQYSDYVLSFCLYDDENDNLNSDIPYNFTMFHTKDGVALDDETVTVFDISNGSINNIELAIPATTKVTTNVQLPSGAPTENIRLPISVEFFRESALVRDDVYATVDSPLTYIEPGNRNTAVTVSLPNNFGRYTVAYIPKLPSDAITNTNYCRLYLPIYLGDGQMTLDNKKAKLFDIYNTNSIPLTLVKAKKISGRITSDTDIMGYLASFVETDKSKFYGKTTKISNLEYSYEINMPEIENNALKLGIYNWYNNSEYYYYYTSNGGTFNVENATMIYLSGNTTNLNITLPTQIPNDESITIAGNVALPKSLSETVSIRVKVQPLFNNIVATDLYQYDYITINSGSTSADYSAEIKNSWWYGYPIKDLTGYVVKAEFMGGVDDRIVGYAYYNNSQTKFKLKDATMLPVSNANNINITLAIGNKVSGVVNYNGTQEPYEMIVPAGNYYIGYRMYSGINLNKGFYSSGGTVIYRSQATLVNLSSDKPNINLTVGEANTAQTKNPLILETLTDDYNIEASYGIGANNSMKLLSNENLNITFNIKGLVLSDKKIKATVSLYNKDNKLIKITTKEINPKTIAEQTNVSLLMPNDVFGCKAKILIWDSVSMDPLAYSAVIQ